MFHPESNPLAPKPSGPLKPEKELVEIWLGKEAAELMEEKEPETGDEDLNPKEHKLTEKEKKILWEMKRPDEVTLRNVPKWEELPDEETLKKDFKFDWIRQEEYRKGRPIEEFEVQNKAEALPTAKVFDIADAIAKAQEKDPNHTSFFTTSEVLEAIDAAGYRPATLEELVAYARDYWKPDADPKTLTNAERDLQSAQAKSIVSLNSVFSDSNGFPRVPTLDFPRTEERKLHADVLGSVWYGSDRFLVLRKAASSSSVG